MAHGHSNASWLPPTEEFDPHEVNLHWSTKKQADGGSSCRSVQFCGSRVKSRQASEKKGQGIVV